MSGTSRAVLIVCCSLSGPAHPRCRHRPRASQPPNIVIMFPDNLGYGEVGIYGGNRGVPTPRIDAPRRAKACG